MVDKRQPALKLLHLRARDSYMIFIRIYTVIVEKKKVNTEAAMIILVC